IRRLLRQLRPYRWYYAGGILIGAAAETLNLLWPQFIRNLINFVTAFRDQAAGGPAAPAAVDTWILAIASTLAGWFGFQRPASDESSAVAVIIAIICLMALITACSIIA